MHLSVMNLSVKVYHFGKGYLQGTGNLSESNFDKLSLEKNYMYIAPVLKARI